ncbi:iron complex transport system substrate-binding protein [Cricetibacter osteomyelitidis]|uniref:Iron complex transport system substrate-binding protein n=1 Tax=Cricetibacter osteomyelitidis TaxID=1521931 RepID=A0A4R2TKC8_9PAST|nr:ABC transporter substrate-binding protein [Cricetibacter osteomyelitidis]TCP97748.1 iron complex transport system substrate-binding protein [Cricetibacter osteomyelitidis]
MFKSLTKSLFLTALLATAPLSQARLVQDIKSNQIELPDQVERVADLWHANNQIVLLLGGADKLVGTTDVIKRNKWFSEVYPRINEVPALTNGQGVQLESLLEVQPQAVLVSNQAAKQEVERAGLKAVLVQFQDFDGLKNTVKITADVLGGNAPTIAETYIKELDGNIRFIAERLKNVSEQDKPTVLHIANANNLYKIDGGMSIVGEWITKAGGKNALPNQANLVEVSMEEIINANPDVIIIGSFNAIQGIKKIKADPLWKSLNAVKNNRIFVNPLGTFPWDRYSGEEALQLLWAAKLFHPEKFADLNMVEKTQDFYKRYYQYNLTKENAEKILMGLDP